MTALPWYKCNPRDFNEGMMGMPPEERGVYVTVLNLIYQQGGPIPDDAAWLASWCGCSVKTWKKVRASLIVKGKIFALENDGAAALMNRRAAQEITARAELLEKRSEAGSAGGSQKKTKPNEINGDSEANAKQEPSKDQAIEDRRYKTLSGDKSPSRGARGSRLPDDWSPTLADHEYSKTAGLTVAETVREEERFRNYWRGVSGQRGVKLDWSATWQNWILNVVERKGQGPPKPKRVGFV